MTTVKQNYRTVNNLFDELFNNVPATWNKTLNVPPVNIHETEDGFHLELVAPGLQKEDFKINVEKGLLTVSYEKKLDNEEKAYKTHRREFAVSSFKRSFSLDEKMNADEIKAKYEAGVLQVFLPKKEEVKVSPKQIEIE
ncbi:MAG: Hsp20/alpha crystallin family protein [Bacteroidota bacterium]|nr:Hsp20/alpha crystallin family protein [Bacteroidota bacterium]